MLIYSLTVLQKLKKCSAAISGEKKNTENPNMERENLPQKKCIFHLNLDRRKCSFKGKSSFFDLSKYQLLHWK